jgi:hypothetical protein
MVDDLVETLRREPGLLLDQMLANSGGTHERLGCETVMEVPKEVRRDNPAQRIHVVLEQGTMFAGHDLGAADGKPRFVTRLHFLEAILLFSENGSLPMAQSRCP